MTLVGDIKEGNFNSHKEYFVSLRNVNRIVSSSPQASRIVYLQTLTVRIVNQLKKRLNNPELTDAERSYLENVCSNVLTLTQNNAEELENLLTDGKLEMKDDERIARLDHLYKEVLGCFTFTKALSEDTGLLIFQREKEKRDVNEQSDLIR